MIRCCHQWLQLQWMGWTQQLLPWVNSREQWLVVLNSFSAVWFNKISSCFAFEQTLFSGDFVADFSKFLIPKVMHVFCSSWVTKRNWRLRKITSVTWMLFLDHGTESEGDPWRKWSLVSGDFAPSIQELDKRLVLIPVKCRAAKIQDTISRGMNNLFSNQTSNMQSSSKDFF